MAKTGLKIKIGLLALSLGLCSVPLRASNTEAESFRELDPANYFRLLLASDHQIEQSSSYLSTKMASQLEPKDFWESEDFAFGYAIAKQDSALVIFAWRKEGSDASVSLRRLASTFLDERLGQIDTPEAFEQWKQLRAEIIGSMLGLRETPGRVRILYPLLENAPADLGDEQVQELPVVIEILPKKGHLKEVRSLLTAARQTSYSQY